MIIAFKNNTLSKKFIALFITLTIIFLTGCQTIKKKSDEVAEKENEKFGQFVGKEVNEINSAINFFDKVLFLKAIIINTYLKLNYVNNLFKTFIKLFEFNTNLKR